MPGLKLSHVCKSPPWTIQAYAKQEQLGNNYLQLIYFVNLYNMFSGEVNGYGNQSMLYRSLKWLEIVIFIYPARNPTGDAYKICYFLKICQVHAHGHRLNRYLKIVLGLLIYFTFDGLVQDCILSPVC